jgi:hypothetical protein
MSMTIDEKMLWDYVDEESDELMLKLRDIVEDDAFYNLLPDNRVAQETLMLKIVSAAMVKVLAIMCEKMEHPSLAMAYIQVVPMHTELLKTLLLKELKNKVGG